MVLSALPDGAIAALVALGTQPLVSVELRHLGGALARPADGALDRLHGAYGLFAVGATPDAETAMAVDVALTRLLEAFGPWEADRPFDRRHSPPVAGREGPVQFVARMTLPSADQATTGVAPSKPADERP